jgi:hypothetical protein
MDYNGAFDEIQRVEYLPSLGTIEKTRTYDSDRRITNDTSSGPGSYNETFNWDFSSNPTIEVSVKLSDSP